MLIVTLFRSFLINAISNERQARKYATRWRGAAISAQIRKWFRAFKWICLINSVHRGYAKIIKFVRHLAKLSCPNWFAHQSHNFKIKFGVNIEKSAVVYPCSVFFSQISKTKNDAFFLFWARIFCHFGNKIKKKLFCSVIWCCRCGLYIASRADVR